MKKQRIKSFIIQNLLERNYSIYVSIVDDSICIDRDNNIGTAIILITTNTSDGRFIIDLRDKKERTKLIHTNYTYVIAYDVNTKAIWLIPVDDIAENRTLTLSSDSKNHYMLYEQSQSYDLDIKTLAIKEAVKEQIARDNINTENHKSNSNIKKKIDDILERN